MKGSEKPPKDSRVSQHPEAPWPALILYREDDFTLVQGVASMGYHTVGALDSYVTMAMAERLHPDLILTNLSLDMAYLEMLTEAPVTGAEVGREMVTVVSQGIFRSPRSSRIGRDLFEE